MLGYCASVDLNRSLLLQYDVLVHYVVRFRQYSYRWYQEEFTIQSENLLK